uniref:Olfactory receptor 77 n=1 Tax=Aulacocentrum confusum TaxID=2767324 RepID=A0A7G8Z996_9HYME|nr:olfactory receptor 77 [Aulacocentrum confusum]
MDSSVATPYHRVNKILLSIIGQWPHQSRLSKRICYAIIFFFTSTHGYFQTAGMIAAFSDIDVFLEALPTVLADVVCGVKMFNFSINAAMMKQLVIAIEEDWKTFSSGPENEILNEYAKFGRKVTIYYAGALYGSMIPMMLVPLTPIILDIVAPMNESYPKHLMFQQIEFLLDFERYFYPLLIHGYLGTFTYLTIIIAIDTMFMVYIQHACAKFAILGLFLEKVAKDTDGDIEKNDYNQMVQCVSSHNDAIESVTKFVLTVENQYIKMLIVKIISYSCHNIRGYG